MINYTRGVAACCGTCERNCVCSTGYCESYIGKGTIKVFIEPISQTPKNTLQNVFLYAIMRMLKQAARARMRQVGLSDVFDLIS